MDKDTMIFPYRWFDTLLKLEADELKCMLNAISRYSKEGTDPRFSGAMAALWNEMQQRIDYDKERYAKRVEQLRENGKKGAEYGKLGGRPKKTPKGVIETPKGVIETPKGVIETPKGVIKTPKKPQKTPKNPLALALALNNNIINKKKLSSYEESINKKKLSYESKEKDSADASLFSLRECSEETFVESSLLDTTANYKRWSDEQFRRSIDRAVEKHPEYVQCREAFASYWTEPNPRGKPRYKLQPTWDTARRISAWYSRDATMNQAKQAPKPPPSVNDLIAEMKRGYDEENEYGAF